MFLITLNFYFFKNPVYLQGLKEDMIAKLEYNSSEKVILFSGDTTATYKPSDISLEYNSICWNNIDLIQQGNINKLPVTFQKVTLPTKLVSLTYLFFHCKFYCC